MVATRLSPTQQEFLSNLFGKAMGNLQEAAKACGIDDYSMLMTSELIEEIKTRADQSLVMSVPRAVHVIKKMLEDEGGMFVSDKLHKVCMDVLDRAGISKQERPSSGGTAIGLVFLPNKQPLKEPPVDVETIEQSTPQLPF